MNDEQQQAPLIPITETVLFPGVDSRIYVASAIGLKIIDDLSKGITQFLGIATRNFNPLGHYSRENLYSMGVLMHCEEAAKTEKGYILSIRTLSRIVLNRVVQNEEGRLMGDYTFCPEIPDLSESDEREAVDFSKHILGDLGRNYKGADAFIKLVNECRTMTQIIGYVAPMMGIAMQQKQAMLELNSMKERTLRFIDIASEERDSLHLKLEVTKKYARNKEEKYREAMLREQLRSIQSELAEMGCDDADFSGGSGDVAEYHQRILASEMPEDVLKAAEKELRKLHSAQPGSAEVNVIMNYLDTLLDLPWSSRIREIDIHKARQVLDANHYGIEEVKDRIIQHLAVMKLKADKQGSILLLVGPPGTGKTSLGKSVAEALDRPYVRASLGGVRDESEIRGHRKTYIGAMPGRIIKGINTAGTMNPVFVLDEIDKLGVGYQGDPAAALLEVLDPEQNGTFSDHYLEVPYDLSDVFFIATANDRSTIPGPLLDRAEIIELSSYTNREKYHIAADHLMPKILEEHGLSAEQLIIDDEAMFRIIEDYTAEAGVRGLKKQLAKLARITSEKIVTGKAEVLYVTEDVLPELLGHQTRRHEKVGEHNAPGVVTGMAWTAVGGEILFTEATFMPGKGNITITGQLGEVMKESAAIAMSLIRSRFGGKKRGFDFFKYDIHIHVPAGATPKDGPSAGVTMTTAIASLVTGIPVDSKLSMTGEVTLSGQVLPVGGIREKVIAAHRGGIQRVMLPRENAADLEDVPEEVKADLSFIYVERVEDVLRETLGISFPEYDIHFDLTLNRPKSAAEDYSAVIL